MLFPTSSLLQSGVVLVPQLAQLNAPTVFLDRFPLFGGMGLVLCPALCSPSVVAPPDGPAGALTTALAVGIPVGALLVPS